MTVDAHPPRGISLSANKKARPFPIILEEGGRNLNKKQKRDGDQLADCGRGRRPRRALGQRADAWGRDNVLTPVVLRMRIL